MAITRQEAWTDRPGGLRVQIPDYVREVVEEVAFQARADRKIDKRSGVSQRLPITTLELVVSNAERRALLERRDGRRAARHRPRTRRCPSITGKFELEYEGELRGAEQVARDLIRSAVGSVFTGMFEGQDTRTVVEWFDLGGSLPLSDTSSADEVVEQTRGVQGLRELAERAGLAAGAPAPAVASAIDFVLEGLYAQKKISRSDERGYAAAEPPAAPPGAPRRAGDATKDSRSRRGRRSTTTRPHEIPLHEDTPATCSTTSISRIWCRSCRTCCWRAASATRHGGDENERTMQALHDAILDALFNGGVLPEETIERLLGDPADGDQEDARSKLEELIQQIIERMGEQGYITMPPDLEAERQRRSGRGGHGPDQPPVTFEVTDKTLDFLGYRALRDLLGSLGKSSFGRHDTREQATGVETTGAPKPYEFGDTLNLDAAARC